MSTLSLPGQRTAARASLPRRAAHAAAAVLVALAAACSDVPTDPLTPAETDAAKAPPAPTPAFVEDFTGTVFPTWQSDTHTLGRGSVRSTNVALGNGVAALSLSAGAYDGAEVYTTARHGPGTYQARMRTPVAPGSISAFFLYEGVPGGNDELDIEIHNDGSRRIIFTTWVAGRETNTVTRTLSFDPAAAHHDYAIEWTAGAVRFRVDGVVLQEFRKGIPRNAMYVMANTWWPVWLSGPQLTQPRVFEIDRIQAGA